MGSVAWMTNEVFTVTYFNLTVYTGPPLVARLTDDPIIYAITWTSLPNQNETTFLVNNNPTMSSIGPSLTAPSTQTFEIPLQINSVSIQI